MKILLDVLKDSKAYYLDVESRAKRRLAQIPKGSIQKRSFGRGFYYYLYSRQGPRVVNKYLGKDEPVQILKQIEERRLLLKRIKEVRQNLAILKRLRWERHAK